MDDLFREEASWKVILEASHDSGRTSHLRKPKSTLQTSRGFMLIPAFRETPKTEMLVFLVMSLHFTAPFKNSPTRRGYPPSAFLFQRPGGGAAADLHLLLRHLLGLPVPDVLQEVGDDRGERVT